jgi:hypothetical protein
MCNVMQWGVLFLGVVWVCVGVGSSPCFLGFFWVCRVRGVCGVCGNPVLMLWLVCLEVGCEGLFMVAG